MGIRRLRTAGIVIHRAEVWNTSDYHFLIGTDGKVQDNVPVTERGEHAIFYNGSTIAIAVVGCFAALEKAKLAVPTDAQLVACVDLMQSLNRMYGGQLWAAGHSQLGPRGTAVPEKLTFGHTCPGERFPLAKVIADSGLLPFPVSA